MTELRTETDSLGKMEVPADKLWGAQTQRSLEHFSIRRDVIPREMITAYATLKKAAVNANNASGRLSADVHDLIVRSSDEILAGQHHDMFPLHVWMTGSGTQFNMNVNEVISNRCCQLAGTALGSKTPVHPNDHVNMSHCECRVRHTYDPIQHAHRENHSPCAGGRNEGGSNKKHASDCSVALGRREPCDGWVADRSASASAGGIARCDAAPPADRSERPSARRPAVQATEGRRAATPGEI
jgi:hypothetical protein